MSSSSETGPQAFQSAHAWQGKAATSWPTSGGTRPGDEGDLLLCSALVLARLHLKQSWFGSLPPGQEKPGETKGN